MLVSREQAFYDNWQLPMSVAETISRKIGTGGIHPKLFSAFWNDRRPSPKDLVLNTPCGEWSIALQVHLELKCHTIW